MHCIPWHKLNDIRCHLPRLSPLSPIPIPSRLPPPTSWRRPFPNTTQVKPSHQPHKPDQTSVCLDPSRLYLVLGWFELGMIWVGILSVGPRLGRGLDMFGAGPVVVWVWADISVGLGLQSRFVLLGTTEFSLAQLGSGRCGSSAWNQC